MFEEIILYRIKQSDYYKEKCFGLNAANIIDRAVTIDYIGGTFNDNQQVADFICLLYRLTIIKPSLDMVLAYINNKDFKYLAALGLVYLRLQFKPQQIYEILESQFSLKYKLRYRTNNEFSILYVDELIDNLLRQDRFCGIILPRLPKRSFLEDQGILTPYTTPLDATLDNEDIQKQDMKQIEPKRKQTKGFSKSKVSKLFKKKPQIPTSLKIVKSDKTLEEVNEKRLNEGLEPLLELKKDV